MYLPHRMSDCGVGEGRGGGGSGDQVMDIAFGYGVPATDIAVLVFGAWLGCCGQLDIGWLLHAAVVLVSCTPASIYLGSLVRSSWDSSWHVLWIPLCLVKGPQYFPWIEQPEHAKIDTSRSPKLYLFIHLSSRRKTCFNKRGLEGRGAGCGGERGGAGGARGWMC